MNKWEEQLALTSDEIRNSHRELLRLRRTIEDTDRHIQQTRTLVDDTYRWLRAVEIPRTTKVDPHTL